MRNSTGGTRNTDNSDVAAAASKATRDNGGEIVGFEREKKFFGFHPVEIVDDIITCVEDYLCDGVDVLEKTICKLDGCKDKRGDVGQGLDKLLGDVNQTVVKNLDKFELYVLQNIFKTPEWLDASADAEMKQEKDTESGNHTAADEEALDVRLSTLRAQLKSSRHMNRTLTTEISSTEAEIEGYQSLTKAFKSKVDASPSKSSSIFLPSSHPHEAVSISGNASTILPELNTVLENGLSLVNEVKLVSTLAEEQSIHLSSSSPSPSSSSTTTFQSMANTPSASTEPAMVVGVGAEQMGGLAASFAQ